MLVRDPAKRYGIKQIKDHKWMEGQGLAEDINDQSCTNEGEETIYNEEVIQQMANIGISREKVIQVSFKYSC